MSWSQGLLKTMRDPKYVVYEDNKTVIMKDMYPKAKYHFLVVPHENIDSMKVINVKHTSLLEYMDQKAREYVQNNVPGINFKYGYHAQPSMIRIHLHVISCDMISECLKTKRHWNSFTTPFFMNSQDVIQQLKHDGKIAIPSPDLCEKYLRKDLKCHICGIMLPNIPKLKQHIIIHDK